MYEHNMDSLKSRVADYGICYDRVMDIVYEGNEIDENCKGASKESVYDELEPPFASGTSSEMSQGNEGDCNSEEPIYEELPDDRENLLNRSLPDVPIQHELPKGRLEIVRSTGNLRNFGGSKGSLYDKLVRHGGGSQQWQSQQTLLVQCSSCSKLIASQSMLNYTPTNSVANSQMDDHQFGIGSISQSTERYTIVNDSIIGSIQNYREDLLSDKFQRINQSRGTWTSAETIFLAFYNENMDRLHEIQSEEEINKVILLGLGVSLMHINSLPKIFQKRYKMIKDAIFNVCKFSVRIGIIPLVYERRTKKKLLPSYNSLKMLFKLGLKDKDQGFILVDQKGKIFKDMEEWENSLKSWKHTVVYPTKALLGVGIDGEIEYDVSDSTRSRCIRSYAVKFTDVTVGITGITLAVSAFGVALVGTSVILPGLLIGEGAVLIYSGVRMASSYLKKRRREARFRDVL